MSLTHVATGDPHVAAHNNERDQINANTDAITALPTIYEGIGLSGTTKKAFVHSVGARIIAFGHSMLAAAGTSTYERGLFRKVCSRLRAQGTSHAYSGAVLTRHDVVGSGAGGIWTILNNWQQTKQVQFMGAYSPSTTYFEGDLVTNGGFWWRAIGRGVGFSAQTPGSDAANQQVPAPYWIKVTAPGTKGAIPYLPQPAIPFFWIGFNDVAINAILGRSVAVGSDALNRYIASMRTALAFTLSAMVFDDNDPSVVVDGTFPARANGGSSVQFGTGFQFLPNGTGVGTISVPADFPGGGITLGFGVAPGATGVLGFTVDGAAAGTLALTGMAEPTTYNNAICKRLTGLAAGAHTITFAFQSGAAANAVWFDWWGMDTPTPGPAIVLSSPKIPPATFAGNFYNNTFSNTDIANWNTALAAMLAAEFPSAIYVDITDTLNQDAANFYTDGLHPNDTGVALVANAVMAKIGTTTIDSSVLDHISSQMRSNKIENIQFVAASADMTVANTSNVYQDVVFGGAIAEISISAMPGDLLEFNSDMVWFTDANGFRHADLATMLRGAIVNYWSAYLTSTPGTSKVNGLASTIHKDGTQINPVFPRSEFYVVQQSDLYRGVITVRARVVLGSPTATTTIFGSAATPCQITLQNHGQPDAYRGSGVTV